MENDNDTIKERQQKEKESLLEQLKKFPIIQVACLKAGISRASFYRWKIEDKEFASAIDKAIEEGEESINDLSEAQLISMIKDKNFSAIHLWLRHHHPKYALRVEIATKPIVEEELVQEQRETVERAIQLFSPK